MLRTLTDSELSSAYLFLPWIERAPTLEEKRFVAELVEEEVKHSLIFSRCLAGLGEDTDRRFKEWERSYRLLRDRFKVGFNRAESDWGRNFIFDPIQTWPEFVMCNFLGDLAARFQLENCLDSSYGPCARAVPEVLEDEARHVRHGSDWVGRLARDPETHGEIEEALDTHLPRMMKIFWDPRSKRHESYLRWKLRRRSKWDVMRDFCVEVERKVMEFGLRMPEWHSWCDPKGSDEQETAGSQGTSLDALYRTARPLARGPADCGAPS